MVFKGLVIFQQSLFARVDPDQDCDGMLTIGDAPFNIILPEPLISTLSRRFYFGHSLDHYDPTA